MKSVHVAVGVVMQEIAGGTRQILISRRAAHQHQGNLWEFPGGKVEPGEPVQQALARELEEELGVVVEQAEALLEVGHAYSDKHVLLDVWWVSQFSGTVTGREGQEWRWVPAEQLRDYDFPAANQPILEAVLRRCQMSLTHD